MALDCILYAIQQNFSMSQGIETETVKDVHGYDVGWYFRNENGELEIMFKFVGDTIAHSIIPATAAGGGVVSGLGQPFLKAGSTIIITTCALTAFNGTFQLLAGSKGDLKNDQVAEGTYKLRKYENTDQNTAMAVVPS